MSSYAIHADFENIASPELIAASLSILRNEGWEIIDYTDSSLKVTKKTFDEQKAELILSVSKTEVFIESRSDLTEQANKFIVDELTEQLIKMVSSPSFDREINALKNDFFMNSPMQMDEDMHSDTPKKSILKSVFSFHKNLRVTPFIILLNIFILVAMVFAGNSPMLPEATSILKWGGVNRSLVLNGDWWRLLTSCFLHYGIIHLAFNMWALYSIGLFLERMIGSWRFAFAYLLAGLAGGLNSIVWHNYGAGAGASGAIFGMFGLFLALLTTNLLDKGYRTAMLRNVVPMILFNLLIGTAGQIDNAAHLGGLFAGLICGYLFAWHFKNPKNWIINFTSILIPLSLFIFSCFLVKAKLPDPYSSYEKIMLSITNLEKKALESESQTGNNTNKSIALWDQAIVQIKQANALELNDNLGVRNERLLFYLQKRRTNALLLKDFTNNTKFIQKNNQSLDSILNIINTKED